MIAWLKKIVARFALNHAIKLIAGRLRGDPAIVEALGAYQANAPFLRIAKIYALATRTPGEAEVVRAIETIEEDLQKKPFRDLLAQLLRGVNVPDFDGDPTDDLSVAEAIDRIVSEALK